MRASSRMHGIVLILSLWTGVLSGADLDVSQWSHRASVVLDVSPREGVVEVPLSPAVYDRARADLADIRLVDGSGETVAHVVDMDKGAAEKSISEKPTRVFNRAFVPGTSSTVTVDFGRPLSKTCIDVETPGVNFRRRIMVEASSQGEDWQVLRRSAWLFRVQEAGSSYELKRVQLPENDFRYLRLTIFHAPDDPGRVLIEEVVAWHVVQAPPETVEIPLAAMHIRQRPKHNQTEVEIDLGYRNLPIHEVALVARDPDFCRRVGLAARNSETRIRRIPVEDAPPREQVVDTPWRPVGGGTRYRFSSGQSATQSLGLRPRPMGSCRCRYLRIRIHNGDNAPLDITGARVTRLVHRLVFQPRGAGPYTLYLGRRNAERPRYDLAHFVDRLRKEGVTQAQLGRVSANPTFAHEVEEVPWSERHKWVLWAVLVGVLIVLASLVWRQSKSARIIDG